ncbi:hypothetical protein Tco_0386733 [Tanacetum coccineum]
MLGDRQRVIGVRRGRVFWKDGRGVRGVDLPCSFNKLKTVQLESLKKLQLQLFGYLADQDHLHFSLCGGSENEEDLSKSFSSAWLIIPS